MKKQIHHYVVSKNRRGNFVITDSCCDNRLGQFVNIQRVKRMISEFKADGNEVGFESVELFDEIYEGE
jgi:hypothetical protein